MWVFVSGMWKAMWKMKTVSLGWMGKRESLWRGGREWLTFGEIVGWRVGMSREGSGGMVGLAHRFRISTRCSITIMLSPLSWLKAFSYRYYHSRPISATFIVGWVSRVFIQNFKQARPQNQIFTSRHLRTESTCPLLPTN